VLRVLNVQLEVERINRVQVMEAGQHDTQSLVMRLSRSRLEVVINSLRGALSDSTKRVLPYELLAHAHDDGGLALSHGLRRERVRNLKDTEGTDAELVSLQE